MREVGSNDSQIDKWPDSEPRLADKCRLDIAKVR